MHGKFLITMTVLALLTSGCRFGGRDNAVSTMVDDGQIVLVRQGANTYGAMVAAKQRMSPDRLEFKWYYRTDGKGTFKRSEAGVYGSGTGTGVPESSVPYLMARFGPFSAGWSGHTDGQGYLYYTRFEGEAVSSSDTRICVTNETDIEKIDATDHRWIYRGSPTDIGVPGGVNAAQQR